MKVAFIALALVTSSAFAAKSRTVSNDGPTTSINTNTTTTSNAPAPGFLLAPTSDKRVYFSTNVVDLAQSTGNVAVDFFLNEKVSANLNMRSNSNRETVKHNGNEYKATVDRSAYGLGATLWIFGNEASKNILVNPYLAFGTKKDADYADTQSGIGLKISGVFRITRELTAEVGGRGDTLDDGFKGGILAGMGYLF